MNTKLYLVFNQIEEKNIFNGNLIDLLEFMKRIAIENEDSKFSFSGISDVSEYIDNYCGDNLKLIESTKM
jgi:hypothetical protein